MIECKGCGVEFEPPEKLEPSDIDQLFFCSYDCQLEYAGLTEGDLKDD